MYKYELRKQRNPLTPSYGKYVARIHHPATVGMEELIADITANCTLKKSDIQAVIVELREQLITHLSDGHIVRIAGIGTFSLETKARGITAPEDFNPATDVYSLKCKFKPDHWTEIKYQYEGVIEKNC